MSSVLSVSDYKDYENGTDFGHVAKFKLTGKKQNGLILQYVKHSTCFDREGPVVRKFTEAWKVKNSKIAHSGKDYFMIPKSYYNSSGTVSLQAHAWFVSGDADELLKQLKMGDKGINASPVSGMLPSEKGKVPAKYRRKGGIKRNWCVSWKRQKSVRKFGFDEVVYW